MITYCTDSGATCARSSAPLIASPPSSVAENPFSEPSSLPIGVRAPAMITDVVMVPPGRRVIVVNASQRNPKPDGTTALPSGWHHILAGTRRPKWPRGRYRATIHHLSDIRPWHFCNAASLLADT